MSPKARVLFTVITASLLGLAVSLWAQVAVPRLQGPVIDSAGWLQADTRQQLDASLRQAKAQDKHQGVVWIVPSLDGEPIEQLSLRAATTWALGDARRDDGWLLLISVADRRARIEVGQGLEGLLTDVACSRVIRQVLAPRLREGDPDGAVVQSVAAIMGLIQGQDLATVAPQRERRPSRPPMSAGQALGLIVLIVLAIVFVVVMNALGLGGRSYGLGRRGRGGWGSGSGWGGGSSSGGGFSGGGGGFSGGGASGGW